MGVSYMCSYNCPMEGRLTEEWQPIKRPSAQKSMVQMKIQDQDHTFIDQYVNWLLLMRATNNPLLFFLHRPPARVCRSTGSRRCTPSPVPVPVQCLIDAEPLAQLLSITALLPRHSFWWHSCNQTSRAVSPVRATKLRTDECDLTNNSSARALALFLRLENLLSCHHLPLM